MTREEAINIIRDTYHTDTELEALKVLIPELSESEDERIRKALLDFYGKQCDMSDVNGVYAYEVCTWLEKQKEQKPAEWSGEDEENFKWFDKFFRAESIVIGGRDIPQDKYLWFKSLRPQPKQEWSEKDEKMRDRLIDRLQFITLNTRTDTTSPNITFFDEIAWLKSLRSRPKASDNWKPSEEQMKQLESAADLSEFGPMVTTRKQFPDLASLYNDLKKQKEDKNF